MKIKINSFGKLPAYQDFVIYECTGTMATSFRKWIESAFCGGVDVDLSLSGRRYTVLIADEMNKEAVVGILRDSTDKGGLRPFPLALFLTLPGKVLKKEESCVSLLDLESLLKEVESVDESLEAAEELKDVHSCLKKWKPPRFKANKKKNPLEEWAETDSDLETLITCLGGPDGDTPWNRLMWGIGKLGTVEGDWLGRGGVRWPVVPEYDPAFLVDLRTHLLNMQRRFAGKDLLPELFSIICPRTMDEQNSGTVIFRSLVPEDHALFRPESEPPPGILDLTGSQPPLTLDGYYGFQSELQETLGSDSLRIGDLFRLNMTSGDGIELRPER